MTGASAVHERGRRWRRSPRRAWLVLRTPSHEVVQFAGPVLELLTDSRTRFDPRLTALGPDVLADDFDAAAFLRRLRADDPTRPIADALLDQRTVAGLGNVWKAEACWEAELDPWRPTGRTSDEEALAAVLAVRSRMLVAANGRLGRRDDRVYGRAGRPCPRCGGRVRARAQDDDARRTVWCPGCQR